MRLIQDELLESEDNDINAGKHISEHELIEHYLCLKD